MSENTVLVDKSTEALGELIQAVSGILKRIEDTEPDPDLGDSVIVIALVGLIDHMLRSLVESAEDRQGMADMLVGRLAQFTQDIQDTAVRQHRSEAVARTFQPKPLVAE